MLVEMLRNTIDRKFGALAVGRELDVTDVQGERWVRLKIAKAVETPAPPPDKPKPEPAPAPSSPEPEPTPEAKVEAPDKPKPAAKKRVRASRKH